MLILGFAGIGCLACRRKSKTALLAVRSTTNRLEVAARGPRADHFPLYPDKRKFPIEMGRRLAAGKKLVIPPGSNRKLQRTAGQAEAGRDRTRHVLST